MKTNIVTETEAQRWVLLPIAENLAAELPGATISQVPDPRADINMFINYALWQPTGTLTTALFTHREREGNLQSTFDCVAKEVDWCFAMSRHTLKHLPHYKTSMLQVWPDNRFYLPSLKLGVCARDYQSGRKRMGLIKSINAIPGVEVSLTGGDIPAVNMPQWYQSLDYLVILADNEGAPLPVLEALACGCPVIAPDVGFAWDFPVLRYTTEEDLLTLIFRLRPPLDGWESTAKAVNDIHERLAMGER